MTETSQFYDPGPYDCATIAAAFSRYRGTGVLPEYLNKLQVSHHTPEAMSVDVATGGAIIVGYHHWSSAIETLTIEAADVTHPRIDRIVVRNTSTGSPGSAVLTVIKGTAATPALAPDLTRSATVYDISLAQVSVVVGTTAITTAMITDERSSDTYCGYSRPAAVGKTAYANVDANGFRVTGLGVPTSASDAARLDSITGTKLDDLTTPDDNTDLNFSTTKHGLCPKGTNLGYFLKDDGTWAATTVYRTAVASNNIRKAMDGVGNVSNAGPTLVQTIFIPANYNAGSVFRITFELVSATGTNISAYLTLNGGTVGAIHTTAETYFVTISQDLALSGGGSLGLWIYSNGTGYERNFRVYCDDTIALPEW
jgi:hypothetical protein